MHETVRTCFVFILALCVAAQDSGQQCFLKDGSSGTCKSVTECISAQKDLRQRIKPITCGFDDTLPIVCCGDQNNNLERLRSRISDEKCREYLKLDIRTTITTTTTTTTEGTNVYFAAVGGVDAKYEEFPHMALLGYGSKGDIAFQCGGSLISDQFVLTAAHCLESRDLGPISKIHLGDLDTASDNDWAEPQDFEVAQTYTPPEYDFTSFYNDIALIKLDRPVIYTRYVKPACLQSKLELEHNNLTATGWGALEFAGAMHSFLQKVELNSLSSQNCLPTYGPQVRLSRGFDEELQICGGNLEKRMDTCQGDSGGPLQLKVQDFPLTHRVVGVTSFGSNCGLVPGIYTRVSKYISWIESIVWPH